MVVVRVVLVLGGDLWVIADRLEAIDGGTGRHEAAVHWQIDPAWDIRLDAPTLERCREAMRSSIGAMKEALADPARNLAREDAFPRLEDRAACRRCPFRRPCGRL